MLFRLIRFLRLIRFCNWSQLTGISVSPGRDQLIVFHSPRGNDLVVVLQGETSSLKEDRIGELVGLTAKRYFEWVKNSINAQLLLLIHRIILQLNRLNKTDLPVTVAANLPCKLGQKQRSICVEGVTGVDQPAFKHSGNIIILEVPPAFCSSIWIDCRKQTKIVQINRAHIL